MANKGARTTNMRVRAYALANAVTMGQVAEQMGVTRQFFSVAYMGRELLTEDQDYLIGIIDEIVAERKEHEQTS